MKKTLLSLFILLLIPFVVIACGGEAKETSEDDAQVATDAPSPSDETLPGESADPANTSGSPETLTPEETEQPEKEAFTFDPADYKFVQKFPAPEGDRRQIVMDYMLKMAEIEWTPAEDFVITWKDSGSFKVKLEYKAGTVYKGLPYSRGVSAYCMFEDYLDEQNRFKDNTYYYEEAIGNNCSTSMLLAYQQLINMPIAGTCKPYPARKGILEFPIDENGNAILETPDTDKWLSANVFSLNGREKVYEAYAALDLGDILYKNIDGSGHTRMVHHVELSYKVSGEINYSRSVIYTVEQTNSWEKNRPGVNTTWWIEHKYTFTELYETLFMPVTLNTFHEDTPLEDAYILYNSGNEPEKVMDEMDGTVTSNFPLNFVKLTLTDKDGNIVSYVDTHMFPEGAEYKVNIRKYRYDLFNGVPSGTYTFNVKAGIARGSCDVETFEVVIP